MKAKYIKIHPKFKLNGNSYQTTELKEAAHNWVKEGVPFKKAIGDFLLCWLNDTPFLEVKTSGSTGRPKKIILQKQQMINSALATGEYFQLQPENKSLLCLSADYIAGKMMLVRAMVLGLEIDCVEPTSRPLERLSKHYDFIAMVPVQLQESLDHLKKVETLIVGGAPISKKLQKKVQKKPTAIFETYGMTETITHVAVKRINSVRLNLSEANSSSLLEISMNNMVYSDQSHFSALPNVFFKKDDRGCLVISAPKISDNFIVTNDSVNLISATEFQWLGRYDTIINSGGVKLFPEQIEMKLKPYIKQRFFVAGVSDDILGQKLVLIIEGEIKSEKLLEKIKSSSKFQKFEIPKCIFVLPEFLETQTGKIQRKENMKVLGF